MKNTSLPLGGILLIDKVEKSFDIFSEIFSGIGGKGLWDIIHVSNTSAANIPSRCLR